MEITRRRGQIEENARLHEVTNNGGRTFVQRAFVQGWHFMAVYQVNMPF